MHTFIIAEAGPNHNGDFETALRLVDAAKRAGVDCVKFQTFVSEELISKRAEKAEYQKKTTGADESQYEMLKKLELSFDQFRELKKYYGAVLLDLEARAMRQASCSCPHPLIFPVFTSCRNWTLPFGKFPPERSPTIRIWWKLPKRIRTLLCQLV